MSKTIKAEGPRFKGQDLYEWKAASIINKTPTRLLEVFLTGNVASFLVMLGHPDVMFIFR